MIELVDSLHVGNELGEGVIWDHQAGKVWWTDIQQSKLYRYDPESKQLESWDTPERLTCFSPIEGKEGLVAAFASGFAFYSPETDELEWIKKIESDNPGTRFNDGRTDRQGRLWAGTMVENESTAREGGKLYCLHPDLSITSALSDLRITNSLCWSPDGKIAYHADTPTQTINRHQYDIAAAEFSEGEALISTEENCFPDGSIVDAEGFIWNAQWGGSKVVRYTPRGEQDLVVDIPTSQVTCVAFGGQDLNLLFVTTAYEGMSEREAQAGDLFIFKTPFKGLIESRFKLA